MERVLLIEDDPIARYLTTAALSPHVEVTEAHDIASGLAEIRRDQTDLVLLDMELPDGTGFDFLQIARNDHRFSALPIVVVTAAADRGAVRAALDAGADDYIVKPFDADELTARVSTKLRQQREWRRLSAVRGAQHAQLRVMLDHAARARSLEQAAVEICDFAAVMDGISGAALITLSYGSTAEVIASTGLPTLKSGAHLDCTVAECLREKATTGPWLESADSQPARAAHIPEGFAAAPFGVPRTRGLVVLGFGSDAARSQSDALAFAIDVAAVAGSTLERYLDDRDERMIGRASVQQILDRREFSVVFQPIVDLRSSETVGLEALTRFDDGTRPDIRFRQAAVLGLGPELELAVIDVAIRESADVDPECFLSVNVSPSTLMDDRKGVDLIVNRQPDVVFEVSEQERVDDYLALRERVLELPQSVRLSVDDAGSGFASLRHILQLDPSFVKLDRSWVQGVDTDPARQALIAGLRHFSKAAGAVLVAEGIETEEERAELENLEVDLGQGFLLGRPEARATQRATGG